MTKRTLSEFSTGAPRRAGKVAAALLLALTAGCGGHAGREPEAGRPAADVSASVKADGRAPEARRVRVSAEGVNAAEPSAASADGGAVYLAWVEHRAGGEADVLLARFDREGRREGEPARVNPTPGAATAWRGDPPDVAVADDGAVYVAWTARERGAAHATTLYLSASRDGGKSFSPPVKVNDDATACVHGMHSLAAGAGGRVYLAWLDERAAAPSEPQAGAKGAGGGMHGERNREVYFATSADGGRTFAPNRRVASDACPCCKTALAVGPGGRVYIGWRQVLPGDFRHIAIASTADNGETFGTPSVVSDDRWELRGCPVSGPALATEEGGALRVLWYTEGEAGQRGLYGTVSEDGGRTFAPRRLLKGASLRGTPLLVGDGRGGMVAIFEAADESGADGLWRLRPADTSSGAELVASVESASASAAAGGLKVAYVAQGGVWLANTDGGN